MTEMGVVKHDLQRKVEIAHEQVRMGHYHIFELDQTPFMLTSFAAYFPAIVLSSAYSQLLLSRAPAELHFLLTKWRSSNLNRR